MTINDVPKFQSTPSARRATSQEPALAPFSSISIHALREESDYSFAICLSSFAYFNPRPPRGERPSESQISYTGVQFQSTPSARRATVDRADVPEGVVISIHALREESDAALSPSGRPQRYFNPRPPRGERLVSATSGEQTRSISIHALREESDRKSSEKIQCFCSIIHTCAQFEKELYEGSGEMQNKSC